MPGIDELMNLALDHHRESRLQKAEALYRQILHEKPDHVEALHLLGVLAYQAGDYLTAERYSRDVLDLEPSHADAHHNLGNILYNQGRREEAILFYHDALRLNPDNPRIHNNLGNYFYEKRQLETAESHYRRAIALQATFHEAFYNLGNVFNSRNQLDEAIVCFQRAITIYPRYWEAHNNLGVAYRSKREIKKALDAYQRAIDDCPDYAEAYWNRSLTLLLKGDFHNGWKEYEWRWKTPDFLAYRRSFSQPLWNGSNIAGKTILLFTEQGYGDAIQFIRYVPMVAHQGVKVIVECQKELTGMIKSIEGVREVVPRGERLPDFDVYSPLLSLPAIFNTRMETIPAKIPYIKSDHDTVMYWQKRLRSGNALKVGLVWAGKPSHQRDRERSLQLKQLVPLGELAGVKFYSLQKGDAALQLKDLPPGVKLLDYTAELHDFADTAALIANLDLVISVDTAVAHLAGAIGKTTWTLLPYSPDWRWLLEGETTPWYPTMRLFRQASFGLWEPVIKRVREELERLIIAGDR